LAIRASLSKEISALVADLSSDRVVVREAAVARLNVIGRRAQTALAALIADRKAPAAARIAALRVFEATGASGAAEPALSVLDNPDSEIAAAAIAALRSHLRSDSGAVIVDRLTAIALDRQRAVPVREAAIRALLDLDRASLRPLLKALRTDPTSEIAALAADRRAGQAAAEEPAQVLAGALEGRLPADGELFRHALARAAETLTLQDVLSLIERIRDHEKTVPAGARGQWEAARAAAHLVLARRGSRIALYDLRETIQRAREPLAMEFLTALDAIGDAASLEPLAKAYASARDRWWRGHLANAFRAIVRRERVTRRHAAVKRMHERDPGLMKELWPARLSSR